VRSVEHPAEPLIAGMATMPTRSHTFPIALASVIGQVDRLYLYLDGDFVPGAARGDERIVAISSRDVPGLRANGKFLGLLHEPADCRYLTIDDDIAYPPTYVAALQAGLDAFADRAIVGFHGTILPRPFERFNKGRGGHAFDQALASPCEVDILGTGTTMFATSTLRFDVRRWTHVNMDHLGLALEAARAGLPLMCLARPAGFLRALETVQPDSIYAAGLLDDQRQTELSRALLAMRAA
jgi:hypothetical protein